MITMSEILKGKTLADQSHAIQDNLEELLEKINKVRVAYNQPMIVTSGLRSSEDQARINPKASHSKHLTGNAVDFQDLDGNLHQWCKDNESLLTEIGLWLENRQGVWQHFQSIPFGSYQSGGTIWFNP